MEVEQSGRRSCFTQTCLGEDFGEDSQLEYLSAHEECEEDKNNSSEFPEQGEAAEVKDMPLSGDKEPPQVTAGEEESGKSQRHGHSVAVEPDIPFLPPRKKAQLCTHAEPSHFSSCEKPAVCTCGTSSTDSTAEDDETQLPVPEILPSKTPVAAVEAADKSCGGSPSAVKSERGEALRSTPGVSVPVQAVDDSRAGFPGSRSSSAQLCLCSRAVNTEVTMMNKTRPVAWLGPASVDAASNTEWSFRAESSHVQESKDHVWICDRKAGSNRPEHANKQTGKNSGPGYCQRALQRAAEAELQLLAVHYEMCYQHCFKVYELALEENTCFGRCEAKTQLYSSLLLVLDELDSNYSSMRMEINMGTPLNELPPLSVELKLSPISSFYVPSKYFRKTLYSDDLSGEGKADLEEPKRQEKGISVNMDEPQSGGDQPGDSASLGTREGPPKDQALEHGCVTNEEGSENWFDAKEDLSVANISVMCRETKKQQGKRDSIDSRGFLSRLSKIYREDVILGTVEVKTVGRGNGHASVHAGGPKASVLEKTSTCSSVNQPGIFVSPYGLNLSSFTKLIRRLQARHPGLSREEIVEAVQEVRKIHKGVLNGLTISAIEEETSAILRRSVRGCQQKP